MIWSGQSPIADRCNQHKPSQPQLCQQPLLGGELVVFGASAFGFDPAVDLWQGMLHDAILPGGSIDGDEETSMAEVITLLQP